MVPYGKITSPPTFKLFKTQTPPALKFSKVTEDPHALRVLILDDLTKEESTQVVAQIKDVVKHMAAAIHSALENGVIEQTEAQAIGVVEHVVKLPIGAIEQVVAHAIGVVEQVVKQPTGDIKFVVAQAIGDTEHVVALTIGVIEQVVAQAIGDTLQLELQAIGEIEHVEAQTIGEVVHMEAVIHCALKNGETEHTETQAIGTDILLEDTITGASTQEDVFKILILALLAHKSFVVTQRVLTFC